VQAATSSTMRVGRKTKRFIAAGNWVSGIERDQTAEAVGYRPTLRWNMNFFDEGNGVTSTPVATGCVPKLLTSGS